MYHSLRLLMGKTTVSEAVAEFMIDNVARTTHCDQQIHSHTVKDIGALARGDEPAISGI